MPSKLFNRSKGVDTAPNSSKSERRPDKLGLRKCVESQDPSRAVDIVFVHGLTGGRESTWTDRSTGCFWPEDTKFLPSEIPSARIFTYGYDADVMHFDKQVSQSRIGNHAQTLLADLTQMRRRTDTGDRPLFFVAHSLGGLVVEDMLRISRGSAEEHHRRVLEQTEGIAFMGTPHCGSHAADWAKVVTSVAKLVKGVNDSIIKALQPDSEVLERIQQDFHTMIRSRNEAGKYKIQITCFYEDLSIPGIGLVVPKHSAILHPYVAMSIPSDHRNMTKFSDPEDAGYIRVSGEIWGWVKDLNERRETKPVECASTSTPQQAAGAQRTIARGGTENYFQGTVNNTGLMFQGTSIGTYNQIGR